jgi:hypothetical protein
MRTAMNVSTCWIPLAESHGYEDARGAALLAKTQCGVVFASDAHVFKVVLTYALTTAAPEMSALGTLHDTPGVLGCLDVLTECSEGRHIVVYVMSRQKCDLASQMGVAKKASSKTVLGQAYDLLVGVARMRDAGILHGDVKPGNVLLGRGEKGGCMLADYGISSVLRDGAKQSPLLYSAWWRPPNIALAGVDPKFDVDTHHFPAYATPLHDGDDVWAAAMVILDMVYGVSLVGSLIQPGQRTLGEENLVLLNLHARFVRAAPRDDKFWNTYDPLGRVPRQLRRKWSGHLEHSFVSFVQNKYTSRVDRRTTVYLLELVDMCLSWNPRHRPSARDLVNRIAEERGMMRYRPVRVRGGNADVDGPEARGARLRWTADFGTPATMKNMKDNARYIVDAYMASAGWGADCGDRCPDVVDGAVELTVRATSMAFAGLGGGNEEDRHIVCASAVEAMRACTMLAFARQRSWFSEAECRTMVYGATRSRRAIHAHSRTMSAVVRILRGRLERAG